MDLQDDLEEVRAGRASGSILALVQMGYDQFPFVEMTDHRLHVLAELKGESLPHKTAV